LLLGCQPASGGDTWPWPGIAGRRFSRWYKTDINRWLGGTYKALSIDADFSE
jgi:hypothetical protein